MCTECSHSEFVTSQWWQASCWKCNKPHMSVQWRRAGGGKDCLCRPNTEQYAAVRRKRCHRWDHNKQFLRPEWTWRTGTEGPSRAFLTRPSRWTVWALLSIWRQDLWWVWWWEPIQQCTRTRNQPIATGNRKTTGREWTWWSKWRQKPLHWASALEIWTQWDRKDSLT